MCKIIYRRVYELVIWEYPSWFIVISGDPSLVIPTKWGYQKAGQKQGYSVLLSHSPGDVDAGQQIQQSGHPNRLHPAEPAAAAAGSRSCTASDMKVTEKTLLLNS